MEKKIFTGILTQRKGKTFLVDSHGNKHLENQKIWDGYISHWLGKKVNARFLSQKDYETGGNIIIMWPYKKTSKTQFIELYYNERLVKYPLSILGHMAVNVNGRIFNYSHLLNENEIISEEEYFYRPALGEFAPHPVTGLFNIDDKNRVYYDKFGRNFMRNIHVLRLEGVDTGRLSAYYKNSLDEIINNPDPKHPEKYGNFSVFTNSCVTIIRDGLRSIGFKNLRGIFPRDFFIDAAYHLLKLNGIEGIRASIFMMPQLKVPEAPYSALTMIMHPRNRFLLSRIPDYRL